jgi:hypothetical protein
MAACNGGKEKADNQTEKQMESVKPTEEVAKAMGESVGIEKIDAVYSKALYSELEQMIENEKLVDKLKKSKIYLTYFNTWCMVITPYSCRQERRQHCE